MGYFRIYSCPKPYFMPFLYLLNGPIKYFDAKGDTNKEFSPYFNCYNSFIGFAIVHGSQN